MIKILGLRRRYDFTTVIWWAGFRKTTSCFETLQWRMCSFSAFGRKSHLSRDEWLIVRWSEIRPTSSTQGTSDRTMSAKAQQIWNRWNRRCRQKEGIINRGRRLAYHTSSWSTCKEHRLSGGRLRHVKHEHYTWITLREIHCWYILPNNLNRCCAYVDCRCDIYNHALYYLNL